MSDTETSGSCLCGSVSYAYKSHLSIFQYCHCSRCRKFTGSAFAANLFVPPDAFRWTRGNELVRRHVLSDARHFATAFCSNCGSSLPWLSQSGRTVVVPAGTLDDDPELRPMQNVFWGSHADWYAEPDSLKKFDELPPRKKKSG